jgi:outer membrane protein, multidrug efflux system
MRLPIVFLLLTGCSIGSPPPPLPDPPQWTREWGAKGVDAAWWEHFGDPTLTTLIQEGRAANLDLQQASTRLLQARALTGIASASLWPSLDLFGGASRSDQSEAQFGPIATARTVISGEFDAQWEVDLFGRRRSEVRAALADQAAAQETVRDVLISLDGEIARNYIEYRNSATRIDIAKRNLVVQRNVLEIARARHRAGLVSMLDVAQAEAEVARIAAVIPELSAQRDSSALTLATLLGRGPSFSFNSQDPLALPRSYGAGLPSELVKRRPDIRRAEHAVEAATARADVARSELFPRVTLSGTIGAAARELGGLGDSGTRLWSIGPSITLPLFSAGRIQSNVELQRARAREALLEYRQAVLRAFEEVERLLSVLGHEEERRGRLAASIEANRRSVSFAHELYSRGLADFSRVLQAQSALYAAEDAEAVSNRTLLVTHVALYKALGGAWEADDRTHVG